MYNEYICVKQSVPGGEGNQSANKSANKTLPTTERMERVSHFIIRHILFLNVIKLVSSLHAILELMLPLKGYFFLMNTIWTCDKTQLGEIMLMTKVNCDESYNN